MNKLLIIILTLWLFTGHAIAQGYSQFEKFSLRFSKDTIFNASEIKNKKFKSVCIIDSMFNVEASEYRDTLFIYEFNDKGNVIHEIGFTHNQRDYDYDFKEKSELPYEITKRDGDSIVKFFAIDTAGGFVDTFFTYKHVYNRKGKEREFEKTPSEYWRTHADCGVGLSAHWTAEYDEQGRVTEFRNLKSNTVEGTTYTPFGYTTETRNIESKELLGGRTVLINKNDEFYSESDGSSLTLINYYEGLISNAVIIPEYDGAIIHMLDFTYRK